MQIYVALKSDHKNIKKLLKQLTSTSEKFPSKRTKLFKLLKELLVPHSRAEERVLYDRLKKSEIQEAHALAFEGYEEHNVVDRLMEKLEATSPENKKFMDLVCTIKENLEYHMDEEEKDTFDYAQKLFDLKTAMTMGEEFLVMKVAILKEMKEDRPPERGAHDFVDAA